VIKKKTQKGWKILLIKSGELQNAKKNNDKDVNDQIASEKKQVISGEKSLLFVKYRSQAQTSLKRRLFHITY